MLDRVFYQVPINIYVTKDNQININKRFKVSDHFIIQPQVSILPPHRVFYSIIYSANPLLKGIFNPHREHLCLGAQIPTSEDTAQKSFEVDWGGNKGILELINLLAEFHFSYTYLISDAIGQRN